MTSLEDAFDTFYEKIALPALPEERIEQAWGRLQDHLVKHGKASPDDVFMQGSYANDTAVRPADPNGSYDLDVCAVISTVDMDSAAAFKNLEDILRKDKDYAKRMETDKKPCVTLRYADDEVGHFHVDIVAARSTARGLEIPIRGDGWRATNPKGYQSWCESRPDPFIRVVRMLKRWRDVNQDERRNIKSIVLQVLVGHCYPEGETDDATAIQQTLASIQAFLADHPDTPPELPNPSLETENLTERWPVDHYRLFLGHLDDAVDLATRALNEPGVEESHRLWEQLLGEDFPPPPSDPASHKSVPPLPPPGFNTPRQRAPRSERYGSHRQ